MPEDGPAPAARASARAPDLISQALVSERDAAMESLAEDARRLVERATLIGAHLVALGYADGGPGNRGFAFFRASNASEVIENAIYGMAIRAMDDDDEEEDDGKDAPETVPSFPPAARAVAAAARGAKA